MTKIVCDICGKSCSKEDPMFRIPIIESDYAVNAQGKKLMTFYSQKNKIVDLCPTCQTNIANFVKILKESNGISG